MSGSLTSDHAIEVRSPWMFGREHDLFFFFLSVLFGYMAFALTQTPIMATSLLLAALVPTAFGAGPFHQGPTWFMFWDAKNRANYRSEPKRMFIFFVAPALVFLFTLVGMIYYKQLVLFIWAIWSIQHLVQQNVGILLLFHRAKDNEAIVARKLETLSQQVPAVLFSLLYIRRLMLNGHTYVVFDLVVAAFAIWSLVLVVSYLRSLRQQALQAGKWINVPALVFWGMSVCSLWTLGFLGNDFSQAFLPPVTWHWFQYIGLNWRLLRNKYATTEIANLPTPHPVALFLATCCTFLFVNTFASMCAQAPSSGQFVKDIAMGVLFGFSNVHYFLDAFIWRFREPYPRAAILPYLLASPAVQPVSLAASLSPSPE